MISIEEAQARFDSGETYLRHPVGKVTKEEASIAVTPDMPAHHVGERRHPPSWQLKEKDWIDRLFDLIIWLCQVAEPNPHVDSRERIWR